MRMSVWGCVLAVMVVEAAAVGVVEKVSVVLGGHTELDCGEGAGILWTRVSSNNSGRQMGHLLLIFMFFNKSMQVGQVCLTLG